MKQETRRKITLPSGATCTVRKLSGMDYVRVGDLPNVLADVEAAKAKASGAADAKAMERGVKLMYAALLNCCGKLTYPTGEIVSIVDKKIDDLKENEISVEELPDADAKAITQAIQDLSNADMEAAKAAKPFSQEQEASGQPASDLPRLSNDAERIPETVPA